MTIEKHYLLLFSICIITIFSLNFCQGITGLRLSNFSVSDPKQGEETSITAYLNIERGRVGENVIQFYLDGASFMVCKFDLNGFIVSGCEGMKIRRIFQKDTEGTMIYNITLNTTNFISGEYNASISTATDSTTLVSEITPLTIRERRHTLFDINLKIFNKEITVKDRLGVSIGLINMGDPGRVDANLRYTITETYGNTVYSETQVVPVETQKEFVKYFDVSSFKQGRYKLIIDLTYVGQKEPAEATGEFSISSVSKSSSLFLFIAQLTLIFAALALTLIMLRRKVFSVMIGNIINTKFR